MVALTLVPLPLLVVAASAGCPCSCRTCPAWAPVHSAARPAPPPPPARPPRQACLRNNTGSLEWECKAQLFRKELEEGDDYRASLGLVRKCRKDKKKVGRGAEEEGGRAGWGARWLGWGGVRLSG